MRAQQRYRTHPVFGRRWKAEDVFVQYIIDIHDKHWRPPGCDRFPFAIAGSVAHRFRHQKIPRANKSLIEFLINPLIFDFVQLTEGFTHGFTAAQQFVIEQTRSHRLICSGLYIMLQQIVLFAIGELKLKHGGSHVVGRIDNVMGSCFAEPMMLKIGFDEATWRINPFAFHHSGIQQAGYWTGQFFETISDPAPF
ncbi:MAG: hypothetical protein ALAOOOJD_03961 [bacterium]|nr:hypothetical protein [bacterium]